MRNTKLIISSFIALVGVVIYFVTVPKVNEEALVQLTVEAGNEELLEDIYFNGHLYDYGSFGVNEKEGVATIESLPYLEKLDALEDPSLNILQKKYPEFINELNYNNRISHFYILNSEDELISGHFQLNDSEYYVDTSTVYLSALDKETNEVTEDIVKREKDFNGDYINIIGMYEEYPVVKILYSTSTWTPDRPGEKSNLSVGEYNFETKNYSEHSLLSKDGGFYEYGSSSYIAKNNEIQIIQHYGNEVYETTASNETGTYVYSFVEDTLSPLDPTTTNYFIGNSNQLYTLEYEGEEVLLKQYDQTGQELKTEVVLDPESPLHLNGEYPELLAEIIDDQLFVIQNAVAEIDNQGVKPTDFQVFDLYSGESLLTGKINYNKNSEVTITEAAILSLAQKNDF